MDVYSLGQDPVQLSPSSPTPPPQPAVWTFTIFVKLHLMGATFSELKDNMATPAFLTFHVTAPSEIKFWNSVHFYTFLTDISTQLIPDTNLFRHLHTSGLAPNFEFIRLFYKNDHNDYEVFSNGHFANDVRYFKEPMFLLDSNANHEFFLFFKMNPTEMITSPFALSMARMQKQCTCNINCIHYFKGHPSPIHRSKLAKTLHFWYDGKQSI